MRPKSLVPTLSLLVCFGCTEAGPAGPEGGLDIAASLTASPATLAAPVFDLAPSPDGSLLAGETFVGITELRKGGTDAVSSLAGVTGIAAIGRGDMMAVTGAPFAPFLEPNARKLFRVSSGNARLIADLGAYEDANNPDQVWNTGPPDSNPFNVAGLNGGAVLVADAAANDILMVDGNGSIDWVAVLTPQLVSTAPFKALIGCPGSGAPECGLPAAIPAQPVATSIAIGPDGAWYAGELTGFPGAPGMSRIWRIAAGSRHVLCPSSACTLAASGLTSIVDLEFGANGSLYVAELDADSWLAVEIKSGGGPLTPSAGGTVKECNVSTGVCAVIASGLALPSALAVDKAGQLWVAENDAIPGVAHVHTVN